MIWSLYRASSPRVDSHWEWDEEDLSDLSSGAVMARYPGFETTAEDAAELIDLAGRMRLNRLVDQ